jgi:hypothetical protein
MRLEVVWFCLTRPEVNTLGGFCIILLDMEGSSKLILHRLLLCHPNNWLGEVECLNIQK